MRQRRSVTGRVAAESVVAPDGTARILLAATALALRGEDCAGLGDRAGLSRLPGAPEAVRRVALTRVTSRTAIDLDTAAGIDMEQVAGWAVDQYPPGNYPGLILGSPHAGAVHLAAAMGVPWLPTAFEVTLRWPAGEVADAVAAMWYGAAAGARLIAVNPGVSVRQVHDPVGRGVLAGLTVALTVRLRRLPVAYRRFLHDALAPGAPTLLLRDSRTWPALDHGNGFTFQVGTPMSGLEPDDFRRGDGPLGQVLRRCGADRVRWRDPGPGPEVAAEQGVEPEFEADLRGQARVIRGQPHTVRYPDPETLSAATADTYRAWLRSAGKSGNRCVVECGRLIDPWQVIRAGMVPYWCERATRSSAAGAEWWLAGSAPFSSVDVLPEPPGLWSPALAGLSQWLAVASFGRRRRVVDRVAARGYPAVKVPTRHATQVLRGQPYDLPTPVPLRADEVLTGLRAAGAAAGLRVY